jgi:hypothetical protein
MLSFCHHAGLVTRAMKLAVMDPATPPQFCHEIAIVTGAPVSG